MAGLSDQLPGPVRGRPAGASPALRHALLPDPRGYPLCDDQDLQHSAYHRLLRPVCRLLCGPGLPGEGLPRHDCPALCHATGPPADQVPDPAHLLGGHDPHRTWLCVLRVHLDCGPCLPPRVPGGRVPGERDALLPLQDQHSVHGDDLKALLQLYTHIFIF